MEETGLIGYRGTIAFGFVVTLTFVSLWLKFLTADITTGFLTTISLAYFGSKTADKVTEVVKNRLNGKKGQDPNGSEPTIPV